MAFAILPTWSIIMDEPSNIRTFSNCSIGMLRIMVAMMYAENTPENIMKKPLFWAEKTRQKDSEQ